MTGNMSAECKVKGGCVWEYAQVRCMECSGLRCIMICVRPDCTVRDEECVRE